MSPRISKGNIQVAVIIFGKCCPPGFCVCSGCDNLLTRTVKSVGDNPKQNSRGQPVPKNGSSLQQSPPALDCCLLGGFLKERQKMRTPPEPMKDPMWALGPHTVWLLLLPSWLWSCILWGLQPTPGALLWGFLALEGCSFRNHEAHSLCEILSHRP